MHSLLSLCILALAAFGPVRETVRLDTGWKFAQGDASSPEKDFGAGTEYFNYLTKAHSIHNTGPYTESFDDSDWEDICLPHDWVTTLPYSPEASHSHGYKTVGYKYPALVPQGPALRPGRRRRPFRDPVRRHFPQRNRLVQRLLPRYGAQRIRCSDL